MEIKDRLLKIISSEGLTSSAFADSIGVQRSSISHILSGRNNPSLDFLQKILTSYPKYNAEWLIMGIGEVFKPPVQPSLFSGIGAHHDAGNYTEQEIPGKPAKNDEFTNVNSLGGRLSEEDKAQYGSSSSESQAIVPETEKKVEKIVVFYSDSTFKSYSPGASGN